MIHTMSIEGLIDKSLLFTEDVLNRNDVRIRSGECGQIPLPLTCKASALPLELIPLFRAKLMFVVS